MAALVPKPSANAGDTPGDTSGYRAIIGPLLAPTWVVIGIFMLLPVILMAVYSFLTKEFRGGVDWSFSLAAYDQFFVTRGLFGDEPPKIEWTYIAIFWRSIWQAALATFVCLIVGFPTAWVYRDPPPSQPQSVALCHYDPLLGEPVDPNGFPQISDPRQWPPERRSDSAWLD
jgi:spermidine/putrescine transport system permease protein